MNKIFQISAFLLIIYGKGQSHDQLMDYAEYYNKDISKFIYFMKIQPSVSHSNAGIEQVVYELDDHNVGIEEHRSNNGKIGEIYVFQSQENQSQTHSKWKTSFDLMKKDKSLKFVKGIFDDGLNKENNLGLSEFIQMINGRKDENLDYGVRFSRNNVYYSLFVIKNKLVFTVDEKNF
ncbi:hypothetical protein [Epilithonimonas caeni]|uniref:hypothetical protein n=1 Tax=Epilithonimonas caeni TaxID=365343 RepID=UPI000417169C|nr:hypothetical protein [Epilithonimonas caeni]